MSRQLAAFELPFPPSVNHCWRRGSRRTYMSAAGKAYRQNVIAAVWSLYGKPKPWTCLLELAMDFEPPTSATYDLDNYFKASIDAMVHAGLMVDDKQIKKITAEMHAKNPPGRVVVEVFELDRPHENR